MKSVLKWTGAMALAGGVMLWADTPHPPEPPRRAAATTTTPAGGVEVYRSALDKEAGAEWSKKQITRCPSGKYSFLGRFGYESAVLSLDNLPEHARVRLSFDLLIMMSWDGEAPRPEAPDVFNVTVDRGPRLVHTTFVCRPAAGYAMQSFPGRFPYDHLPAGTSAEEGGTLGYHWDAGAGNGAEDYIYHIERTFAHSGGSLKIAFSGINLEAVDNEAWGLKNVRVEVLPAKPAGKLDEVAFDKFWRDLGSQDPKSFVPAVDGMIGLGEPAVATIRKRLIPPTDKEREQLIGRLIAGLDDDAYAEREKASAALRALGVAAEPALREAQQKTTSPEVRVRIAALLRDLGVSEAESESGRRHRRLVEVLELIGTEPARAGLSEIVDRGGSLAAWEATGAIQRLEGKAEIPTKLEMPPGLPKPAPPAPPVPPEVESRSGPLLD